MRLDTGGLICGVAAAEDFTGDTWIAVAGEGDLWFVAATGADGVAGLGTGARICLTEAL